MHGPEVTTDANGAADYRPSDKLLRKEGAAIYARLIQQAFGFNERDTEVGHNPVKLTRIK